MWTFLPIERALLHGHLFEWRLQIARGTASRYHNCRKNHFARQDQGHTTVNESVILLNLLHGSQDWEVGGVRIFLDLKCHFRIPCNIQLRKRSKTFKKGLIFQTKGRKSSRYSMSNNGHNRKLHHIVCSQSVRNLKLSAVGWGTFLYQYKHIHQYLSQSFQYTSCLVILTYMHLSSYC